MSKQRIEDELLAEVIEDMDEKEIDNLFAQMGEYQISYPREEEINSTILTLNQYVPKKKKAPVRSLDKFMELIDNAKGEVSFISNLYWLASIALFVLGFIVTFIGREVSPYITLMMLAPIPFVLGILEVFKGREQGVMEIEMACKRSVPEIILARLTVIGIFNVLLNSILSIGFSFIDPNIILWRIVLTWLTPFTLVAGTSLWLAMKIRGGYLVSFLIAVWMAGMLFLLTLPNFLERMLTLNVAAYVVIIAIGITIIFGQISKIISRHSIDHEGRESFETNI